ncbi:MAG TPA: VOC family protein [Dehalococcoidia bacterium]|nr:VOC family protein [Dehalococcoidia bacterium]
MTSPRLVPELVCSDLQRSLAFYTGVLGFMIAFRREEESFAYLEREGAELMLQGPTERLFLAGELQPPYGRGINLQIEASDVDQLHQSVMAAGAPVYLPMEEKWYRRDQMLLGNRQFIVQDPDGYLLRFFRNLGSRPA